MPLSAEHIARLDASAQSQAHEPVTPKPQHMDTLGLALLIEALNSACPPHCTAEHWWRGSRKPWRTIARKPYERNTPLKAARKFWRVPMLEAILAAIVVLSTHPLCG